jgi:hypothetical protein
MKVRKMNRMKTLTLALAVLAAGAPPLDGAPPAGAARYVAKPEAAQPADFPALAEGDEFVRGKAFRLPVTIDLSDVKIDGAPAPLGAYLVRVSFDPSSVRLKSVRGGETKDFSSTPVHTFLDKANETGTVALTAMIVREDGPTGLVSVARLAFVETAAGGRDSVTTEIVSVVTPILPQARQNELRAHPIAVAR